MASPGSRQLPRRTSDGSAYALPSPQGRDRNKGMLSDRYQMQEELGRGACGHVFKATDIRTKEVVAIKQLSLEGIQEGSLKSIMSEIDLLKNLNHKNIVKYIGSFKTRTHLYIILEYMENGALSQVIKSSEFGAFPESLVAVYISQVLQGLAYLHDQGVVHRDIKGANILTTKDGLVKLADFGVAARLSELEIERDAKSSISVVGTPYWMAPEVIEMTSVTPASDIWSVACLAIELVTGSPPYFDLQPMSALFRIVQDDRPEYPNDLSPDMKDFLAICFNKDPQKRPSARGLLRHKWVQYHRATLRNSWSRTQGLRSRGQRPSAAHTKVSVVVDRILQAEANEFAAAAAAAGPSGQLPAQPAKENLAKTAQNVPMNQQRRLSADSRTNSQGMVAEARGAAADPAAPSGTTEPSQAVPPVTIPQQPSVAPAEQRPEEERQGFAEEQVTERAIGLGSRRSSRANSVMMRSASRSELRNGPLDFMLCHSGPPGTESGEDLNQWLEFRDQGRDVEDGADVLDTQEDLDGGSVSKHQGLKQLRIHLKMWRAGHRQSALKQESERRADEAMVSGEAILTFLKEDRAQIDVFISEDGPVVVYEILQDPCSERLAIQVLRFINELICVDLRSFGAIAEQAGLPLILQYATGEASFKGDYALDVRLQAAYLVQTLAQGTLAMSQLLTASRGFWACSCLVEPDFQKFGPLVHIGVNSIWSLLELQGMSSMKRSSRMLAAARFPERVVGAFKSAHARYVMDKKMSPKRSPSRGPYPDSFALERMEEDLSSIRLHPRNFSSPYSTIDATEGIVPLMTKMAKLILALAYADTEVKASMCNITTIQNLFSAIEQASEQLQLITLSAVKRLSTDPMMLPHLEAAQTIQLLGKYLNREKSLPIQVEALHALHNLCKISRGRQEEAARVGLVPYLMSLAQMSRKQSPQPNFMPPFLGLPRGRLPDEICSPEVHSQIVLLSPYHAVDSDIVSGDYASPYPKQPPLEGAVIGQYPKSRKWTVRPPPAEPQEEILPPPSAEPQEDVGSPSAEPKEPVCPPPAEPQEEILPPPPAEPKEPVRPPPAEPQEESLPPPPADLQENVQLPEDKPILPSNNLPSPRTDHARLEELCQSGLGTATRMPVLNVAPQNQEQDVESSPKRKVIQMRPLGPDNEDSTPPSPCPAGSQAPPLDIVHPIPSLATADVTARKKQDEPGSQSSEKVADQPVLSLGELPGLRAIKVSSPSGTFVPSQEASSLSPTINPPSSPVRSPTRQRASADGAMESRTPASTEPLSSRRSTDPGSSRKSITFTDLTDEGLQEDLAALERAGTPKSPDWERVKDRLSRQGPIISSPIKPKEKAPPPTPRIEEEPEPTKEEVKPPTPRIEEESESAKAQEMKPTEPASSGEAQGVKLTEPVFTWEAEEAKPVEPAFTGEAQGMQPTQFASIAGDIAFKRTRIYGSEQFRRRKDSAEDFLAHIDGVTLTQCPTEAHDHPPATRRLPSENAESLDRVAHPAYRNSSDDSQPYMDPESGSESEGTALETARELLMEELHGLYKVASDKSTQHAATVASKYIETPEQSFEAATKWAIPALDTSPERMTEVREMIRDVRRKMLNESKRVVSQEPDPEPEPKAPASEAVRNALWEDPHFESPNSSRMHQAMLDLKQTLLWEYDTRVNRGQMRKIPGRPAQKETPGRLHDNRKKMIELQATVVPTTQCVGMQESRFPPAAKAKEVLRSPFRAAATPPTQNPQTQQGTTETAQSPVHPPSKTPVTAPLPVEQTVTVPNPSTVQHAEPVSGTAESRIQPKRGNLHHSQSDQIATQSVNPEPRSSIPRLDLSEIRPATKSVQGREVQAAGTTVNKETAGQKGAPASVTPGTPSPDVAKMEADPIAVVEVPSGHDLSGAWLAGKHEKVQYLPSRASNLLYLPRERHHSAAQGTHHLDRGHFDASPMGCCGAHARLEKLREPTTAEAEPLLDELRQMAISLICGMVHTTEGTRSVLRSNGGVAILLELLKEEDWQGPVLDALATWLTEDFHRMVGQLTERGSVQKFVTLFKSHQHAGGSDSLARLLEPFLKILKQSSQLTVELAVAGLPGAVVEMLRTANAVTALHLLQMVAVIYEHHPRPKEYVAKYNIIARLHDLKQGQTASVIVKKRADSLLQTFSINYVF